MGNVYSQSGKPGAASRVKPVHHDDDADWDAGMEADVVSLLEENARLRALVVRLSDLVLKSVVDQK